jgi:hypothetical protein
MRALDRFRLARVETRLEVAPDALAAREHGLVARTAWGKVHDADVVVAIAVAARVCGGLIQGPKAVALPLSPHVSGELAEARCERNPRFEAEHALCAIKRDQAAAQRQLHGLQSRPERTK